MGSITPEYPNAQGAARFFFKTLAFFLKFVLGYFPLDNHSVIDKTNFPG
jgi:hypothetical protein